jgi:hypothetical protein
LVREEERLAVVLLEGRRKVLETRGRERERCVWSQVRAEERESILEPRRHC